ncbi:MAG: glycosyltransferase [Acidobacteria bacterium]|nr:glycosyltransferase [Acidobacteriota bacterium]
MPTANFAPPKVAMKENVSIVIPTWNGLSLLQEFLPSVLAAAQRYAESSRQQIELLIVDDGSHDDTIAWLESLSKSLPSQDEFLKSLFLHTAANRDGANEQVAKPLATESGWRAELRWVKNEINKGFSAACNKGIAAARYPLILLLNNDVEIAADAIAPLVENFADEKVFAAHCRVVDLTSGREVGTGKVGAFASGFIRVHQSYATREDAKSPINSPFFSMFAGGGAAMFDRQKFLAVGGFEDLLSPFYWEDVELSYRAWKRGYTIVYEPRSLARHRLSSTIAKLNQRRVRMIEQRNRLIYHWIHLHDGVLLTSHLLWVALLALLAPLRLQPSFLLSVSAAVKRLPQIRQRRRDEKQQARRSDREVFALFAALRQRPEVTVYDKSGKWKVESGK